MARLLVVSRSMALAMRLADAHEVIEYPVDQVGQLAPGDDIDAIVLDLGEPSAAVQALDRLRGSGYSTGVLMVSGYQPSWAGLVAVDLPAVVVVPLPITKAALLHGVDELTRGRPNRSPAPPPRGWNGSRPGFVPAPPPAAEPPPAPVVLTAPTPSPVPESASWTALLAPAWGTPPSPADAVPHLQHPTLAEGPALAEADESIDVAADLTESTVRVPATPITPTPPTPPAPPSPPSVLAPDVVAAAPTLSAPTPFAPAAWALRQASPDHRSAPATTFTPYQVEPTDPMLLHRHGDRLQVESPVTLTGFERPPGDDVPRPPEGVEPETAEAETETAEAEVFESEAVEPQAVEPQAVEPEAPAQVLDLDALEVGSGWTAQDFDWWRPLPDEVSPTGDTGAEIVGTGADTELARVWVTEILPAPAPQPVTADVPPPLPVTAATPPPLPVTAATPPPLPVTAATPPPLPVTAAVPPPLPVPDDLVPTPLPVTSTAVAPPPLPVRVRSAVPAAPAPFDPFPTVDDPGLPATVRDQAPPPTGGRPAATAPAIDTSLFEPSDDVWRRQRAAAEVAARDRGELVTAVSADSADSWTGDQSSPPVWSGGVESAHPLRSAQEVSESIAARRALLGRPDLVSAPSMLSRRLAGRTPTTNGSFSPGAPAEASDTSLFTPDPIPATAKSPTTGDSVVAPPPPGQPAPAAGPAAPSAMPQPVPSQAPIRVSVTHEPLLESATAETDGLPAGALVAALGERLGELFGVSDTAQVLADEIVDRVRAEAVAVVVGDGDTWRVAGGIGLRPLERRLTLTADHWLVAETSDDGRAVLIGDTDAIRASLAGAPLAAWHYLLALPVPGHQAFVVLARGPQAEPFGTGDVAMVAPAVREAAPLLRTALQTRTLARRLAALRDLDPSTG